MWVTFLLLGTKLFYTEDSWSIKICPSISEVANLSPKTNILFLCKVLSHTGPNINGKIAEHHTHAQTHTHIHTLLPPFTWFLTYWAQTYGIYTLQIKQTHTQPHTQTRSNTHQTDGERTDSKRFTLRGRRGLKADRKSGHGRSKEQRGAEEAEEIRGREKLE